MRTPSPPLQPPSSLKMSELKDQSGPLPYAVITIAPHHDLTGPQTPRRHASKWSSESNPWFSSSLSPALNGVQKDFHDCQPKTVCQEQNNSLKSSDSLNGDLHLHLDEHVPVVIGLMPQDYIQYTVPLDEGMYLWEGSRSYCLDSSSPMEVSAVPPQVGGSSFVEDENQVDQNLVVAPEIFVDQSVNGLLIGTRVDILQSARASHDDVSTLSPLVPPMQNNQIQRNFSGLIGTDDHVSESMHCHLNLDPNSAPGIARVYDSVQSSGPMVVTSLTEELKKLGKQGWYWGPITC
ncbi:Suppressor of cytokine signaling 6 [Heterocephalus glaber]|uniref:Suppressor of cytokine signaling 6 n=1 Tax=Heterocephalus glaber TaxID=10181 RepID=G5BQN9_HETGA|nr:Suppressor of cytokine signaling 6 [Heterocephalus glaber]